MVNHSYDDRGDDPPMVLKSIVNAPPTPADILVSMAETFRERAKIYGDNYKRIGPVLEAMFPDGITLKTADDHNHYHLYMMMMVKMTRLAVTEVKHQDSVHDIAVYAAMLESFIKEED